MFGVLFNIGALLNYVTTPTDNHFKFLDKIITHFVFSILPATKKDLYISEIIDNGTRFALKLISQLKYKEVRFIQLTSYLFRKSVLLNQIWI